MSPLLSKDFSRGEGQSSDTCVGLCTGCHGYWDPVDVALLGDGANGIAVGDLVVAVSYVSSDISIWPVALTDSAPEAQER